MPIDPEDINPKDMRNSLKDAANRPPPVESRKRKREEELPALDSAGTKGHAPSAAKKPKLGVGVRKAGAKKHVRTGGGRFS